MVRGFSRVAAIGDVGYGERKPAGRAAQNVGRRDAAPTTSNGITRLPETGRNWPRQKTSGVPISSVIQPSAAPLPPPSETVNPGPVTARGRGVTLDAVTQITLAQHPQIRQAEAEAAAARARMLQASFYPNPTMGTASPQLTGNQTQYNAYMVQDLVTMGKIRLDASAAERAARQAEWTLVRTRFDVLTNLRQKFYTALVAQQRVEILERMVRLPARRTQSDERLLEGGLAPRGDVLLLQIELAKARPS